MREALGDEVEGHDREEVDYEPPPHVIGGYQFAIIDDFECLGGVSGVEADYNVQEEKEVDDVHHVHEPLRVVQVLVECQVERSQDARE